MLVEERVEGARGCHPLITLAQGGGGVCEDGGGGTGVERGCGAFEGCGERGRVAGGPDEEGGVEGDDVAQGAGVVAFEDVTQEVGVGVRVGADLEGVVVDRGEVKGLRIETGFGGSVGGDFDDARGSCGGDFGGPFEALDDEGAGPATALHESDDAFDVGGVGDANDVVGAWARS